MAVAMRPMTLVNAISCLDVSLVLCLQLRKKMNIHLCCDGVRADAKKLLFKTFMELGLRIKKSSPVTRHHQLLRQVQAHCGIVACVS